MLSQLGTAYRMLSAAVVFAGAVGGCFCEAQSDIPVGKDGRPKGPMWQQRLAYLGVFAAGVPGVAWGFVRAIRRQQKTPWE